MSEKSRTLREASEARRTYRKFLPEAIERSTIEDWLKTASTAPSGADMQPWHFCVVTDPEMKRAIREASEAVETAFYEQKISDTWRSDLEKLKTDYCKPFLTEAPCLIVIFKEKYRISEKGKKVTNYYVNESVGIAIGLLINAVRDSGYHSLTYTPAPMTFLNELFGRPEGETAVMILVVGKKDDSYELPKLYKKKLAEIADFY